MYSKTNVRTEFWAFAKDRRDSVTCAASHPRSSQMDQKPPGRTTDPKATTRNFPHKPKTIHPTEHRKRIDDLLKRSVYREPPKKPYDPPMEQRP